MIVNTVLKRGKLALSAVILSAAICQSAMAESRENLEWTKVLGPDMSSAASVEPAGDGGLIVSGEVREAGGQSGLLLIKTDAEGKEQWSRTMHYNGYGRSSGKKARPTRDGGYIVAGTTYNTEHGKPSDDMLLVKTDAQGNIQWQQRFDSGASEKGEDVAELPDGGYLISGTHVTGSIPARVGLITRTDAEGRKLWTRVYGDLSRSSSLSLHTLLPLGDGTFLAGGQRGTTFLSDEGKAYVVRVNEEGETLWEREFVSGHNGDARAELFDLQPAADGGFIATGHAKEGSANGFDVYVLKLDKDVKKQWEMIRGGAAYDVGNAVRSAEDGGYVVSAALGGQAGGNSDMWIVKTDGGGKPQWEQKIGGPGEERGSGIVQTGKRTYVAVGGTTLAKEIPSAGGGASGAKGSGVLLAKVKESSAEQPRDKLAGIEFQNESYNVSLGQSVHTVVYAVYENGSRHPLTGDVRYYSNNAKIARIDGQGVLTGLTQGTTFLTAEYKGETTNALVSVRDPKAPDLIGLAVEPERLELSAGTTGQLRLKASYSDGSVKDVTGEANWYMNDRRIAVPQQGGVIRALAAGYTFVTAEYNGLTAVIDITVK